MSHRFRTLVHFVAAVVGTAVLASLWESHRNLAAIAALGHGIDTGSRLSTIAHDLVGFGPAFAALGGVALLLGFLVAAVLGRLWPPLRPGLYVLAGAASIATMLQVMELTFGITVVASARDAIGIVGLSICGAAGGLIFALLQRQR